MEASSRNCDRMLDALARCARQHPRQQEVVCASLHAAAAWCLLREACPQEGERLVAGSLKAASFLSYCVFLLA
jgi:hypothetical protein